MWWQRLGAENRVLSKEVEANKVLPIQHCGALPSAPSLAGSRAQVTLANVNDSLERARSQAWGYREKAPLCAAPVCNGACAKASSEQLGGLYRRARQSMRRVRPMPK